MCNTIQVIAGSGSKHPVSRLIKRKTWCDFTHCGLIDGDYVIEAKGPNIMPFTLIFLRVIKNDTKYGGVIRTPLNEFKSRYKTTVTRQYEGDITPAKSMVNKVPFDVDGLVGAWLKINIHDKHLPFCCELIAMCIKNFDMNYAHKSQPSWFIAFGKEVK